MDHRAKRIRSGTRADDYGVPTLADDSAALCANARVRHLPQATHWTIHDAPDLVRDALLDHL